MGVPVKSEVSICVPQSTLFFLPAFSLLLFHSFSFLLYTVSSYLHHQSTYLILSSKFLIYFLTIFIESGKPKFEAPVYHILAYSTILILGIETLQSSTVTHQHKCWLANDFPTKCNPHNMWDILSVAADKLKISLWKMKVKQTSCCGGQTLFTPRFCSVWIWNINYLTLFKAMILLLPTSTFSYLLSQTVLNSFTIFCRSSAFCLQDCFSQAE